MTFASVTTQVEARIQELLATPEGRAATAKHLALLEVNNYGMGEYVDGMLPRVAPQWDGFPEERNRLFEALKDAVRTGVDLFIDDTAWALVHGSSPALRPGVEPPACEADPDDATDLTFSTRRPRQALEAVQGGDQ